MLEQAADSLKAYLKANVKKIIESSINVNVLREEWLKLNPQYEQYDLQLDVEWLHLKDEQRWCMNGCCPWVPPMAKDFTVSPRDWTEERYISRKMEELKVKRSQVAAAKEDLAWDQ